MSERPVEGLIGWTPHHDPWADAHGLPFDGWWDGSDHRARAEVDDLADWLERNGYDWSVQNRGDPGSGAVAFVSAYDGSGRPGAGRKSINARAALVAAVRAVTDQEEN